MFLYRTHFARVRIPTYVLSVAYVSTTYVIPRHTYSSAVDVRIHARTSLREIQIRDYAVKMESGLHSRGSRSRDYTEQSGSDEEDPLGPSGLSLAPKFTIDIALYICDVDNKITA